MAEVSGSRGEPWLLRVARFPAIGHWRVTALSKIRLR